MGGYIAASRDLHIQKLIGQQDHVLLGISYRVNVLTGSALANPEFASEAARSFNEDQTGMVTSSGGGFLGELKASIQYISVEQIG